MKKRSKSSTAHLDVPVQLDCSGADILDPTGVHPVSMKIVVHAEDSDDGNRFEGEIDFVPPHNLPKNFKLPKIEISHPTTSWTLPLNLQIDDAFINQIIERKLIYRFIFKQKVGAAPKQTKAQQKRGNEKAPVHITSNTLAFDASSLFIRGGSFKPVLSCSASCKPFGFKEFTVTMTTDVPLLSDAQIRKFKPVIFYIKGLHQMPEINPQDKTAYIAPYLSTPYGVTIPQAEWKADIKYNTALILWNPTITDMRIEIHDREVNLPEFTNTIGSGYVEPKIQPAPVKNDDEVLLSIENILGIKKDSSKRPYGYVDVQMKPGRSVVSIQPMEVRDSVIPCPTYFAFGSYLTVVIEPMVDYVPQMQVQQQSPIPATPSKQSFSKKTTPPKKGAQPVVAAPVKETKLRRVVVVAQNRFLSSSALASIQERIVMTNGKVFGLKDLSTVGTMKIEQQDCDAVSGFIVTAPPSELVVLEFPVDSISEQDMYSYLIGLNNVTVFYDESDVFTGRTYGCFDCAVKKFKFETQILEILQDKELYIQNSHLSMTLKVFSQLNQMINADTYAEIKEIWPSPQDLEMANAKKGVILTMEEQAFPPLTKELIRIRSLRWMPKLPKPEEPVPELEYTPVNQSKFDYAPHDLRYFAKRHQEFISKLEKKNGGKNRNVYVTEDGETEIYMVNKEQAAQLTSTSEWIAEAPETFTSIAYMTQDDVFSRNLRETTGDVVRGGTAFNCNKTPKSALGTREELLTDKNHDPWTDGDYSLARADERWFKSSRLEPSGDFRNVCKRKPMFSGPEYLGRDLYRPKTTLEKREYATKAVKHTEPFRSVTPMSRKDQELKRGEAPTRPLTVIEKFRDRRDPDFRGKFESAKKPRFSTMYTPPTRKGKTDSISVKKFTSELPNL